MYKNDLAKDIFERKYAGNFAGRPVNYYKNLAKLASLGNEKLEAEVAEMMIEGRFSPGGRILAYNGRVKSSVSLMNCTTHQVEEDSLHAISETVKTIMLASSHGQGIGVDLSALRPRGANVNNAAKTSTGAISFMELFNSVGGTIGQEGRRAAILFSMRIDHPDLYREDGYDFLRVKTIPGKVENANISVMITDAFMEAVEQDLPWTLEFNGESGGETFHVKREVQARELFHLLAESAWKSGEPGVLFLDTIHEMSNSDLFGPEWAVVGVNACSEMMLDQNGVCNLGSLNLSKYVIDPYLPSARFDFGLFILDVEQAVEFLDNILEIELADNRSISEAQRNSIQLLRRVGLGVMGLADLLVKLNLRYDTSEMTASFLRVLFITLRNAAYRKSVKLAEEKGPCLAWENLPADRVTEVLDRGFYGTLPEDIKIEIALQGLRNVTLLSIAPTGSISNLLGVASGIEPIFAREYVRRVRMGGEDQLVTYIHPGVGETRALGLPDSLWQTAYEVSPEDHVRVQALIQEYIDSAIAKTTNLPSSATVEDVEKIYMLAWELGLKGITVYRDASRQEQVLYTLEDAQSNRQLS